MLGCRSPDDGLTDPHLADSTVLDNSFRALFEEGGIYSALFYAYEDTGLFRRFPFVRDEAKPTYSSICVSTGMYHTHMRL